MALPAPRRSTTSRRRRLRLAALSGCLAALTCVAVAGTRPTVAQAASARTTLTLHLLGGGLAVQVDGISSHPSGDGRTVFDAVLEVDDATGSGNGWLVTVSGAPQTVQVVGMQADCVVPSSCVAARPGTPGDDTSHVLIAAQPESGMGRQVVEVVFDTAGAASGTPWSFSVTPRV